LLTLTHESSRGRDARQDTGMQLHQAEYMHASRRWSTALQYRRFTLAGKPEAALITDVTWYFRNDVSNSNLHWLKLVVDRRLIALQYYFYR
jgi:hypothetical protein